MRIIFFNRTLMSGGIEKSIENLIYNLSKEHEIEIVYSHKDKLDSNIVHSLEQYAKVTYLGDKVIEADLCIYCYLYFDYSIIKKQIKAKYYWLWVHSKPRELENCLLDNQSFLKNISKIICVSEDIKNRLQINKDAYVIHNLIDENIKVLSEEMNPYQNLDKNILKLVVVSRISNGKGFDRLLKLVKSLEKRKTPYILKIVGKGRAKELEIMQSFSAYPKVEFVGYQKNPYPYIKHADYLVMLSDYEAWGNVITEAKILQVPCVITDFSTATEQIANGKDGIIVPRNLIDCTSIVDYMVKNKEKLKNSLETYQYINEIEKWTQLIEACKTKGESKYEAS